MTSKCLLQPPLFCDCNSPEKHARLFSVIKTILNLAKLTVTIIADMEQAHFDSKPSVFWEAASKNNPKKPISFKCII